MWKLKQFEAVNASDEIAAVYKRRARPENKSIDLIRAGGGISSIAGRNEDYIAANLQHKDHRNFKSAERRDQYWETSSKAGRKGGGRAITVLDQRSESAVKNLNAVAGKVGKVGVGTVGGDVQQAETAKLFSNKGNNRLEQINRSVENALAKQSLLQRVDAG